MKVKPKTVVIFQFCNWKCKVILDPRQKWSLSISNNKYIVERDNTALELTKEEFEKHFSIIEK